MDRSAGCEVHGPHLALSVWVWAQENQGQTLPGLGTSKERPGHSKVWAWETWAPVSDLSLISQPTSW